MFEGDFKFGPADPVKKEIKGEIHVVNQTSEQVKNVVFNNVVAIPSARGVELLKQKINNERFNKPS